MDNVAISLMPGWRQVVNYDPIPALLDSGDESIVYFAQRDLLDSATGDSHPLWELPTAERIVRRQRSDGSWRYPGGNNQLRSPENYDQIETFRNLGYLVEMFGFTIGHPSIVKAVEFLFSFQTVEGDIRGILGNQYAPYYTAAMVELFLKVGLTDDPRVERVFEWLSSVRQNDGGWTIPLRTHGRKLDLIALRAACLEPDTSKPFSWLVTGVVLRAYAAHPFHRNSAEAHVAAQLVVSSFFRKDNYPDRGRPDYWLRFTYPFWFTDLISATDSITRLGFTRDNAHIDEAVQWFICNQQSDGLWRLKALKNDSRFKNELWLSLSICRIVKRLET